MDLLNLSGSMELEFIHLCGGLRLWLHSTEEIKMAKVATSKKQKKSGMKSLKAHAPFTSKELKNSQLVIDTLLECIRNGDIESFREVLTAHLMTLNKAGLAKKAGIGRRTLYDLMDPNKEFNPALSTISAVIRSLAA